MESAARDIDVSVALDGSAVGGHILVIDVFQYGATRCGDGDVTARNGHITCGRDALGDVARMGEL